MSDDKDDGFKRFCAVQLIRFDVFPGWKNKSISAQKEYLRTLMKYKDQERVKRVVDQVIDFVEKLPTIAALNTLYASMYSADSIPRPACQHCNGLGWKILINGNLSAGEPCLHCNPVSLSNRTSPVESRSKSDLKRPSFQKNLFASKG